MIHAGGRPVVAGRAWSLLLSLMLALSAVPYFVLPAAAQGTATITVNALDGDGVTPLPFTRVQVTASSGQVYGPLETLLNGSVSFPVDLGDGTLTFLAEVETPPACGIAPESQTLGPLTDGEAASVDLVIQSDPSCNLGTLAVYQYDCPDGFDTTATAYEAWRDGCTEEVNGVIYTFTSVDTNQQWNPETGKWGIDGRAPIVGLPPGDYRVEEQNAPAAEAPVFYCLTYATPSYATSPSPSSIDRIDSPDGVATIPLNNNRVSCDVFKIPAPAEEEVDQPVEEVTPEEGDTTPAEPTGNAVTTSDVNFRSDPDPNSAVLLVLQPGTEVELLGDQVNGFYPVRYQGQDGWVSAQFLQIGEIEELPTATEEPEATQTPSPTAEPTTTPTTQAIVIPAEPVGQAVTTSDVNMRDGASVNANVVLVLPPAAEVDVLGDPDNGFYPVSYQGQAGWVSEAFLDLSPDEAQPTQELPTATSTAPTGSPAGKAVTTSDLNMRSNPDGGSGVVLVLPEGAEVELLGPPQNGFYPIRYQGQEGWASGTFLSLVQDDLVQAADEGDTASIELHKSVCEPGYEPGANIYNDCHEDGVENVTFFIEGPDDFAAQDVTERPGGTGPGIASFTDLAAGTYAIDEDVPGDVTTIFVYCSLADSDEVVPFVYNDIQGIDIELTEGMQVICDWYNIPDVQPAATGYIELHKSVCEAGYEPDGNIFDDCHEEGLADVTFFIEGPEGFSDDGVTVREGGVGPGKVAFSGLAAGEYSINEDVPGDFTDIFVYCSLVDSDDEVPFTYNDVQGIDLELTEGMQVICDWYNIPVDQIGGTGYIELHKAVCEPGYEPNPDIFEDCHGEGLGDVTFFIEGPEGFSDQAVTNVPQSPGPGIVAFDALSAGDYSIAEDVPNDFTSIYVYCSLANSDQVVPFTYNDAGGIDIELFEGMAVICDWYNIPDEQETGSVEVLKRTCPVGYDHEAADFNDFYNDCITRTNDVNFILTPDGGDPIERETGTDGNGRALFTGLGTGDFELFEDLPLEFVTPFAYCGPDDQNLSAVPVVNGTVDIELTGGSPDEVCLWFNVPEDLSGLTGQISLTKFLCPEGTTSNYYAKCSPNPLSGATFNLNGPGSNDFSDVTDGAGDALFDELPAGNYSIQEIPPAGVNVAVYVVACQAGGAAYKFTYDDSTGMRIKLNLPVEGDIHCNWYNVPPGKPVEPPPGTGGQGSITVHKFLCSGKAISEYDWDRDCLVQISPEGFALETPGGARISTGTTNANGKLTFKGLANGAYSLDETTGDWCHAEADYVDAGGNVLVRKGGNTNVYIYNCGARQVGTLPVTGSGDTAKSATASVFAPAAGALVTMILMGLLLGRRRRPVVAAYRSR